MIVIYRLGSYSRKRLQSLRPQPRASLPAAYLALVGCYSSAQRRFAGPRSKTVSPFGIFVPNGDKRPPVCPNRRLISVRSFEVKGADFESSVTRGRACAWNESGICSA